MSNIQILFLCVLVIEFGLLCFMFAAIEVSWTGRVGGKPKC